MTRCDRGCILKQKRAIVQKGASKRKKPGNSMTTEVKSNISGNRGGKGHPPDHWFSLIKEKWIGLTVAQRFLVLAVVPLGLNTWLLGDWVVDQVASRVVHAEAASSALYVDSLVEPLVQELVSRETLPPPDRARLDELASSATFTKRFAAIKLWNRNGTLIYSSLKGDTSIEKSDSDPIKSALQGKIIADIDTVEKSSHPAMLPSARQILEIYSPIRKTNTDQIIAVAEIYDLAEQLQKDLASLRKTTWLVVATLSAAMLGLLFSLVYGASKKIIEQQRTLTERVAAQEQLIAENDRLRKSLDAAHWRSAESTERFMRRVGADLHDGPAQYIGLVSLYLEELQEHLDPANDPAVIAVSRRIGELLTASIDEIRSIAEGLAPPELNTLGLPAALHLAVRNHEWRTGTHVDFDLSNVPDDVPPLLKICLYRFIQEGLGNAFRHAGGKGQKVRARCRDGVIHVEVSDAGPGMNGAGETKPRPKLGLSIMRDRIESLGGTLTVTSSDMDGTRLVAQLTMPGREQK